MAINDEVILLVESDPGISNLISRQVLQPLGYHVRVVPDANRAIQQVAKFTPDLIISNINLPGLSGKDLLVALRAQGLQAPLIMIAENGQENDVIQAFRLGASDCLFWPARDAEVVSVVERNLRYVREDHSRQEMGWLLKETKQELEQQARELTTLMAIGKAVLSTREQSVLFEKIIEGAIYVTEADYGWVMLLNESSSRFDQAAQRNLPAVWVERLGKTLDDDLSGEVALSGKTLALSGTELKRFKVANLGQSAAAAPIKIDHKMVGSIVIVRGNNHPIDENLKSFLETMANYASISLVNTQLFHTLQEMANGIKDNERHTLDLLAGMRTEIEGQLLPATRHIDELLGRRLGPLSVEQENGLILTKESVQHVLKSVEWPKPPNLTAPKVQPSHGD